MSHAFLHYDSNFVELIKTSSVLQAQLQLRELSTRGTEMYSTAEKLKQDREGYFVLLRFYKVIHMDINAPSPLNSNTHQKTFSQAEIHRLPLQFKSKSPSADRHPTWMTKTSLRDSLAALCNCLMGLKAATQEQDNAVFGTFSIMYRCRRQHGCFQHSLVLFQLCLPNKKKSAEW